jgi:hypothetical protein
MRNIFLLFYPDALDLGKCAATTLFARLHSEETEREKRRSAKKTDAHTSLALK